jgi:hypothetical protein
MINCYYEASNSAWAHNMVYTGKYTGGVIIEIIEYRVPVQCT